MFESKLAVRENKEREGVVVWERSKKEKRKKESKQQECVKEKERFSDKNVKKQFRWLYFWFRINSNVFIGLLSAVSVHLFGALAVI